jgi:peroxiredoxin
MQRDHASDGFPIGSAMPAFSLKNVDGKQISNDYFNGAKAAMVVFSCNHCPYVKGSDEMLISIVRKFEREGLKTVAISSNDAVKYPEDSFDNMKVKAQTMHLPFPYLYDESQEIARKFDAACTPEVYLFDAAHKLAYHGTINNSPRNPAEASVDFLSQAITQVLEGQKADPPFIHPIGCSIKWK